MLLLLVLPIIFPPLAHAHHLVPMVQTSTITVSEDSVELLPELHRSSLTVNAVWNEIDTDGNGIATATERDAWIEAGMKNLHMEMDGESLAMELRDYTFPTDYEPFLFGTERINLTFTSLLIIGFGLFTIFTNI